MQKALIYGIGRMGLTHYAILNQIVEGLEVSFVDPNEKINYFAKRNISAKVYKKDSIIDDEFDLALICTPPTFHIPILEKCLTRSIPKIFVEKPFGGISSDFTNISNVSSTVTIGYVLRFNPIISWVKSNICLNAIHSVNASYFSNTIESKPKGWRNTEFSGVTNELGSHIIDLCVYLFGLKNPTINNKRQMSIISDVDDILVASLNENSINFDFHFDWVNRSFRKPVFKFELTLNDDTKIIFDQQKLEHFSADCRLLRKISTVDIEQAVPFYLRGVDFTSQMQDFVGEQKTIASLSDAMVTRDLIKNLVEK